MGKRTALVLLAFGCACSAGAQASASIDELAKDYRRMPSFDELMQMNDAQRAIVIDALRVGMIDAVEAEVQSGTRYASTDVNSESSATAWIGLLLRSAHAESKEYCPRLGYILEKSADGACPQAPLCVGRKNTRRCNPLLFGKGNCVVRMADPKKMELACANARSASDVATKLLANEIETKTKWMMLTSRFSSMCAGPSYSEPCKATQDRLDQMWPILKRAGWIEGSAPRSTARQPRGTGAASSTATAADGRTATATPGGAQPASSPALPAQSPGARPANSNQNNGAQPPSGAGAHGCDRQGLIADMSASEWERAFAPEDSVLPFRMAIALMCERGPIDESYLTKRAALIESARLKAIKLDGTQSKHKQNWVELLSKNFRTCLEDARHFRAQHVPPPPKLATLSISAQNEVATLRVGENAVVTSLSQVGGSMGFLKVNDICSIKIDEAPLRAANPASAPAPAAALGNGGSAPARVPRGEGARAADSAPGVAESPGLVVGGVTAAVIAHQRQIAECRSKYPGAIPLNDGNFCRPVSSEDAAPANTTTGTR